MCFDMSQSPIPGAGCPLEVDGQFVMTVLGGLPSWAAVREGHVHQPCRLNHNCPLSSLSVHRGLVPGPPLSYQTHKYPSSLDNVADVCPESVYILLYALSRL